MNFKVSETKKNLCQVPGDARLMLLKLTKSCTQKQCTQMGATLVPETLLGANHSHIKNTRNLFTQIRFQQQALLLHKSNKQTNNPICVV